MNIKRLLVAAMLTGVCSAMSVECDTLSDNSTIVCKVEAHGVRKYTVTRVDAGKLKHYDITQTEYMGMIQDDTEHMLTIASKYKALTAKLKAETK